MNNKQKPFVFVILVCWLVVVATSLGWNIAQENIRHNQIHLENARDFFGLIVTTRLWNAQSGGVYAPITDTIQPNPYLEVPNREITTTHGTNLTMINPAYMTRLISELANTRNAVMFNMTSLDPINPSNAPSDWERTALNSFEAGQKNEYFEFVKSDEQTYFNYMAPLITDQSCLICHAKQGYKVGDIRGGIRISIPEVQVDLLPLLISHAIFAVFGSAVILFYGGRLASLLNILEKLSNLDGLTQVANRRRFDEQLNKEFLTSKRFKVPLSIAICDVDHFKIYNDTFGHPAGDECLKIVAREMSSVLKRPLDLISRYGGEEFGIILPHTNGEAAKYLCSQINQKISSLQIPQGAAATHPIVTVSIGVSTYFGDETSLEDLLRNADKALYAAKQKGRNQVIHFLDLT